MLDVHAGELVTAFPRRSKARRDGSTPKGRGERRADRAQDLAPGVHPGPSATAHPSVDTPITPAQCAVVLRPALLLAAALTAASCGGLFAHPDAGAGTSSDGGSPDGGATQTNFIPLLRNPATGGRAAEGTPVRLENVVVTGIKTSGTTHGFFVQDPNVGAWGGIYVFVGTGTVSVAPGAVVSVTGSFHVFRELDEIDVTQGSVTQTGSHAVPSPLDVALSDLNDTGARAAELQSMLLRIKDVQVSAVSPGTDFTVVDSATLTTSLVVSSYIANDVGPSPFAPAVGTHYASLTGFGYVTGPASGPFSHKLAPRSPLDLAQ